MKLELIPDLIPQPVRVEDFFKFPEIGELLEIPKPPERKPSRPAIAVKRSANPRAIYSDTLERPDHYTPEQKALAKKLHDTKGEKCSERELLDLLIAFYRPTELREASARAIRKLTSPRLPPKKLPPATSPLSRKPVVPRLEAANLLDASTGPIIRIA